MAKKNVTQKSAQQTQIEAQEKWQASENARLARKGGKGKSKKFKVEVPEISFVPRPKSIEPMRVTTMTAIHPAVKLCLSSGAVMSFNDLKDMAKNFPTGSKNLVTAGYYVRNGKVAESIPFGIISNLLKF